MFETKNDLDPAIREEAVELLNDRLADCIDLHTQVKHAHWNVKGPEFIALHKLFDISSTLTRPTSSPRCRAGSTNGCGSWTRISNRGGDRKSRLVDRRRPTRIDTDLSSQVISQTSRPASGD